MNNALRATTQTLAAALGGADAITTLPFDALSSVPGETGDRLARNTQSILALESHLTRVADPAAGSHFLERRTRDLAEGAWEIVRNIEGRGGARTCLLDGWWRERLDEAWSVTEERLNSGAAHVLGASIHPGEERLEGVLAENAGDQELAVKPLPVRRPAALFE